MQTASPERDRNVQGVLGTAFTATWRRAHGQHALTLPLDVERTKTVRSGPSGSAIHMELHAQARVAVPPTLPLDVERTKTVRSGPSVSAIHMELHAQGRVAVPPTLPLDVERTETVRSGPNGRAAEAPVGGDRRPGTCSGVPSRRPGGLPTTRVPRARGARGTCARQEPPRVRPGPTRRPRRCERCAEIDEYVAQK